MLQDTTDTEDSHSRQDRRVKTHAKDTADIEESHSRQDRQPGNGGWGEGGGGGGGKKGGRRGRGVCRHGAVTGRRERLSGRAHGAAPRRPPASWPHSACPSVDISLARPFGHIISVLF